MGCAQSKIDNEESVSRCKERRNLMKEAASLRNAFASTHSGFSVSLKITGVSLSDYTQGHLVRRLWCNRSPPPSPTILPSSGGIKPSSSSSAPSKLFTHHDPSVFCDYASCGVTDGEEGKMKGIAIDESDIYEEEEEEEEERGCGGGSGKSDKNSQSNDSTGD